jgi:hypothetical protein
MGVMGIGYWVLGIGHVDSILDVGRSTFSGVLGYAIWDVGCVAD